MSLVEGNDLTDHIRLFHPMTTAQIADCILPVIDAVTAAHDAGIVHRDLKPSNIRLARGPFGTLVPKVLDFGISKLTGGDEATDLTESGTAVGTVGYMSPEQLRSSRQVDARSDIYALGIILYECATGRRPYDGDSPYDLMHAILTAQPVAPGFLRSDLPAAFDALVLRAMHRDPSERFASGRGLRRALAAFTEDPAGKTAAAAPGDGVALSMRPSARAFEANACLVAPDLGFQLVEVGDLGVAVWLHTAHNAAPVAWTRACRAMGDILRARIGGVSSLVVTDGGAPNAVQRKELLVDMLGGDRINAAVVTTVLGTNPIKRGIATAVQWLNPRFRFFEPRDILLALDHIGITRAQFEPIWASLAAMQQSLPPIDTLRLVARELDFPPPESAPPSPSVFDAWRKGPFGTSQARR